MPPTNPVAYRQSGPDVTALQNFLIGQGIIIPAGATGYFGDQTKAALASWQQSVGISSSTPGFGINWGPQSMQAAQSVNSSKAPGSAGLPGLAGGVPMNAGTATAPTQSTASSSAAKTTTSTGTAAQTGTGATASSLTFNQAAVGAAIGAAQSSAATGSTFPGGLAEALKAAATNPSLIAQYSDVLKMDTASFQQSLQALQVAASSQLQQQKTQFENERKQVAEAQAAAGTAYSGFRGKAQQDLAQTEQGIVTSSRAQAQKAVQDLTSQFESKYGTGATTPYSMAFLNPFDASNVSLSGQKIAATGGTENVTGQLVGGITGSQAPAQQADVRNLAAQYMNQGSVIPTQPLTF